MNVDALISSARDTTLNSGIYIFSTQDAIIIDLIGGSGGQVEKRGRVQ